MKHFPSVTRILDATRPQHEIDALEAWKARVGEEQAERIRQEAITRGQRYDAMIEDHRAGKAIAHPSLAKTLQGYSFLAHEKDVFSETHRYKGRLDSIYKSGTNIIINDYKGATKVKSKEHAASYFMQLAAYWHAVEEMSAKAGDNMVIDYGLITWILPTSVSQQLVSRHTKELYFEAFIQRVEQYHQSQEQTADATTGG